MDTNEHEISVSLLCAEMVAVATPWSGRAHSPLCAVFRVSQWRARSDAPYRRHPALHNSFAFIRGQIFSLFVSISVHSWLLSLFRFSFCCDADFGDSRPLERVHQSNEFLHGQIAIGSNHDCKIRIRRL